MQYTEIFFSGVKIKIFIGKFMIFFFIFAQNIDCRYTLELPRLGEAILTSTFNLCFGTKLRKIMGIPYIPHF